MEMENELYRGFAGLFRQENEGPVYVGRHFIPMPDPSEWPVPVVGAKTSTPNDSDAASHGDAKVMVVSSEADDITVTHEMIKAGEDVRSSFGLFDEPDDMIERIFQAMMRASPSSKKTAD